MMMALAVYEDRISVMFDNSSQVLLVSCLNNEVTSTGRINISAECAMEIARRLKKESVEILICGAISDYLRQIIEMNGIKIISWISGTVADVLDAWLHGTLENLVMPGCCRSSARKYGGNFDQKRV